MKLLKHVLEENKKSIYCKSNNLAGKIAEITYNKQGEIQYAVMGTKFFAGEKERYFAIPVLPAFMEVNGKGNLILNLDEEDLILAKRIHFDDCPTIKANGFFPSVYEVSDYKAQKETHSKRKFFNFRREVS